MKWFVYTLRDASSDRIRYIGMTHDVKSRMIAHSVSGDSTSPKLLIGQYIASQREAGKELRYRIENGFATKADALRREKELINKHQGSGLMNIKGNRRGNTDRAFREYMKKKSARLAATQS